MKILCLLIAILLSVSAAAADIHPEIGVGITRFHAAGNGIWRQDGFEQEVKLNSPSIELGATGHAKPWLQWRAGYKYLGRVTSDAMALSSDEQYERYKHDGMPADYSSYGHLARWQGHGQVHGAYASILPAWRNFVLEIGAFAYRASWHMAVTEWQACVSCPLQDVGVQHKNRWAVAPFYGIGWQYNGYTVMANVYPSDTGGDEFPAVYGDTAVSLTIRKAF